MLPPDLGAVVLHAASDQDDGMVHLTGVGAIQDPDFHCGAGLKCHKKCRFYEFGFCASILMIMHPQCIQHSDKVTKIHKEKISF